MSAARINAGGRRSGRIALTWGDPAGIGPETTLKALAELDRSDRARVTLFGSIEYMRWLRDRFSIDLEFALPSESGLRPDALQVDSIGAIDFAESDFGRADHRFGAAALAALDKAVIAALDGRADLLVTAPLSKGSVADKNFMGHTEYLRDKVGAKRSVMMFWGAELSVALVTTHISLRSVFGELSIERIVQTIEMSAEALKKFGFSRARIAVAGLNPHASEGGRFGDEEERIIIPAIERSRSLGLDVSGPYPADTLFTKSRRAGYDLAIAHYHDQGLIALKALSFGETINVTLGLPFLRFSVDHGTAFDIAGSGKADHAPMAHSLRSALAIVKARR